MAVFPVATRSPAKAITTTVNTIIDVLERYRLDSTSSQSGDGQSGDGRSGFVPVIQNKVEVSAPIQLVLPGFPFKSPNTTSKVLGTLPDKAEEFALAHLNSLCESIRDVYKGGAELTIVSDGLVYNDLLGVPDRDVWAYGQAVRKISQEKGFTNLKFARLHTLQHVGIETESITEELYLQQATTFREKLQSGLPTKGIAEHLARDEDARATYKSYISILTDDLASAYRTDEQEITARRMIARGRAFAAAIQKNFPESVRLSIHPGSSSNKFSISLLPIPGLPVAAWQTTLVFSLDGSVHTAYRVMMEAAPNYELVYRNGEPWFFREKSDLYTWEGMDVQFEPLYPFGLAITPTPGAAIPSLADVDMIKLGQLAEVNSPLVIRGFRETENRELFVRKASEMGAVTPWDKKVDEIDANKPWGLDVALRAKGYDFAGRSSNLPLRHNDGLKIEKGFDENRNLVSISQAPSSRYSTAMTPSAENVSYTIFASSRALFDSLPSSYTAESLANTWPVGAKESDSPAPSHFPLVLPHPATGANCLQYDESWLGSRTHFDPAAAGVNGDENEQSIYDVIEKLLCDRRVCLWHEWQESDIVVSDNFSMIYTRNFFGSDGC